MKDVVFGKLKKWLSYIKKWFSYFVIVHISIIMLYNDVVLK